MSLVTAVLALNLSVMDRFKKEVWVSVCMSSSYLYTDSVIDRSSSVETPAVWDATFLSDRKD